MKVLNAKMCVSKILLRQPITKTLLGIIHAIAYRNALNTQFSFSKF